MYDLLITDGRVVDGSGNAWYRADIGITGDTIAAIGRLRGEPARRTIQADGLVVCPGFIDMHCHSDIVWLAQPDALPKVRQGVTTDVIGQCGMSYAPASRENMAYWRDYLAAAVGDLHLDYAWTTVGEFLDRFGRGVGLNMAFLVPHGNVRMEVLGLEKRPASDDELAQMCALVERGMREGAFGLSTGLMYKPSMYADTRELIELSRTVARLGGLYATHMRQYVLGVEDSFEEVCTISRQSGAPAHISHFNTTFEIGSRLMDGARLDGLDITYDLYPYNAGCSLLAAYLPDWVHEGTTEEAIERLRKPEHRQRLRADMDAGRLKRGTVDKVYLTDLGQPQNKLYRGMSLRAAAETARKAIGEFLADLLIDERFALTAIAEHTHRTEVDVERLLQRREQMVGSDGVMIGEHPHPRGYGTFPRILGVYVRERRVLELEEAVRKMTWAPASRLGLKDRGLLLEGWKADITCFDPDTVIDRATYEQGKQPPEGIPYVIVNGEIVVGDGKGTGSLSGKALRSNI